MSASSKKKIRNAQAAEKMTQRQQAEQKEARKLKLITATFCVVLAVLVLVAAVFVIRNTVNNSGFIRKHTVAATVSGHDLNSVEMNYYYVDAINSFYNSYSDYISYFITSGVALDQQTCAFASEGTWADYFIDQALSTAAATYAMYDAAVAEGYQLSEEAQSEIEASIETQTLYAVSVYGYSNLDAYLAAMYGSGANEKSFTEYLTVNSIASYYYSDHVSAITYTEDEIREADDAEPLAYNSYSYCYYYLPVSDFYEGGTEDEDGNITYSDEEIAAAEAAAKDAAESLLNEAVVDADSFDLAIAVVNSEDSCTTCTHYGYSSLLSTAQEWISDTGRTSGDKSYFEYTSDDTLKGYYVVLFTGMLDNTTEMINIRHILITPEEDTEEGWAEALKKAEEVLDEWKSGDATEDSFAELANDNSEDTGSNTVGGLYENVYYGQMVDAFNDWCFDSSRQVGDTDIVETSYGYHVMYFVGTVGQNYRDYLIEQSLLSDDVTEWYTSITENYSGELKNSKYILTDLTLN